jgi:hypothetical protein
MHIIIVTYKIIRKEHQSVPQNHHRSIDMMTRAGLIWALFCFVQIAANKVFSNFYKQPRQLVLENFIGTINGVMYMIDGASVIKETETICSELPKDDCLLLQDSISLHYYGTAYTPSRPDSSIEDYHADRRDIIKYISDVFKHKHYLEIGCQNNLAFDVLKNMYEYAVGVDPSQGGTHRMTSDEFFQQNNLTFDIIFIDGLHTGPQVWVFINAGVVICS